MLVTRLPLHLKSHLLLLGLVLVGSFGHDIVHLGGQVLTRIGAKFLNELHQNFIAPLLLEFVLAHVWDALDYRVYELDFGLFTLAVAVKTVLEHVVSEITLNHLVQFL